MMQALGMSCSLGTRLDLRPPDPMVKHGLLGPQRETPPQDGKMVRQDVTFERQLMDLDKLLEKHQQDTEIRTSPYECLSR